MNLMAQQCTNTLLIIMSMFASLATWSRDYQPDSLTASTETRLQLSDGWLHMVRRLVLPNTNEKRGPEGIQLFLTCSHRTHCFTTHCLPYHHYLSEALAFTVGCACMSFHLHMVLGHKSKHGK
jgi:hypothetical protein